MNCSHFPQCPGPTDSDASAAAIITDHCEQGWYRLCNGLILFDDGLCLTGSGSTAA